MKFAVLLLLAAHAFVPGAARADVAAIVAGEEISREEIAAEGAQAEQAVRFRDLVLGKAMRRYIAERALAATSAEVAELVDYHREFTRRDRAQRSRKLVELNERLARPDLPDAERARLEQFRAVLVRLAAADAESDLRASPDVPTGVAPYVEWWKANKALYEEYGGPVVLTRDGPLAYGARASLIADYERRDLIRFFDMELRAALFALLARPPTRPVPPEAVDFTPYWRRPIPPSYFPD